MASWAGLLHMWLMNLYEMWDKMIECMDCDLVELLGAYLCWNWIHVDVNALILLCDWWICMVMNQVNEGMVVAYGCEYTYNKKWWITHTQIREKWIAMSDHRKSENHEGIYHDEHLRGNKS
jgi:hypothetical protein